MKKGRKHVVDLTQRFNHKGMICLRARLLDGNWADIFIDQKGTKSNCGTFTIVSSWGTWSVNFTRLKVSIWEKLTGLCFSELFVLMDAGGVFDLDATVKYYMHEIKLISSNNVFKPIYNKVSEELMNIRTDCKAGDKLGFLRYIDNHCPHFKYFTNGDPITIDWANENFKIMHERIWETLIKFIQNNYL